MAPVRDRFHPGSPDRLVVGNGPLMELVWTDECAAAAGTPPDSRLWGVVETDRWQPPDELQIYVSDPATAAYDGQGHLVVSAIRQETGGYVSARLSARRAARAHMFRYGRFAARIRVPTGTGVWPAWWLLGADDRYGWPSCGEIDIMEAPASAELRGQVHQGTHSPHSSGVGAVGVGVRPSVGDWGRGFHTYAIDWAPGRIAFFIDGRCTGTVTREGVTDHGAVWPFDDQEQAPVLNLAVGGWAGTPDETWSRQSMVVDWVRVYG